MINYENDVEEEIRILVEISREREVEPKMLAYAIMSYLREIGITFTARTHEELMQSRLERYVGSN